ncbi:unnamed protein product [Brassica napus]|uniref:(rape) hypothetical protein n=1 Tax=Brassica napus TaxID=3708 RepID=A0A816VVZ1_BRANA|nr:unnamed protein product [Brassica napus]
MKLEHIVFLPAELHPGSFLSMRWRVRERVCFNRLKSHAKEKKDTCLDLSLWKLRGIVTRSKKTHSY